MRAKITYSNSGERRFEIEGREVTEAEFYETTPPRGVEMLEAGLPPQGHCTGWSGGLYSDALACHPNQIPQMIERNKRHGVNVEYAPDGRPILRSRGQRRDLMKLEGCHDNDGGYGDDTGASTASTLPSREEIVGPSQWVDEGTGYVGEATKSFPGGELP